MSGINENIFFDLRTERAVIGAALLDSEAARLVSDLPEDVFQDVQNAAAHRAIRSLVLEGGKVDLLTVDTRIRENGESVPSEYLIDCPDMCPIVSNVKAYISILRQCAARRQLLRTGRELMARSGDATADVEGIRDWASGQIREIHVSETEGLISMSEAVAATYKKLGQDQKDDGTQRIPCGIPALDERLGGLRGSEMVVIGARPGVGKSILALTFCLNAARLGKRVLLVSLEMDEYEITERVLACESGVPMEAITSGKITADHWVAMGGRVGKISSYPLWYCLEAGTVERIRRAAFSLAETGGLDMIAVDYLQLLDASYAKKQSRQEQIAEISRGLKKLSQEMGIPILVLSQLNRSSEKSSTGGSTRRREPSMSDARDSGAIEQDANIFILMHAPAREEMKSQKEEEMWDRLDRAGMRMIRLIIDKNRQGKCGRITVGFDGSRMRFMPL